MPAASQKTTLNPSVRAFSCYRTFLISHAQQMKATNPRWSAGVWARKIGLKNTSSITKVLQGQRNPGPSMRERLIDYFKFAPRDAQYFRDLVALQKFRNDPQLSVLLMEKMGKVHADGSIKLLDEQVFRALSNWYYLPLREMTRMKGFDANPKRIAKRFRFKVTARDISRAIEGMLQLGLLARTGNGGLEISDRRLETTSDCASEAIKRYHEQMIGHALDSVRSTPVDQREFTGASFVMNRAAVPKAKELIRTFRKDFAQLLEADGGDALYQFQIQLFPLNETEKLS